MLLYKNHRFHCEGVSFAIPDGYCLETSYEESSEDTLHLWTPDAGTHLCIGIERETNGPMQELAFILRELEQCIVLEEPSAVMCGGLGGFSASYQSGDAQYRETHLGISGTGDNQTGLVILISTHGQLPNKAEVEKLISEISPCRE